MVKLALIRKSRQCIYYGETLILPYDQHTLFPHYIVAILFHDVIGFQIMHPTGSLVQPVANQTTQKVNNYEALKSG